MDPIQVIVKHPEGKPEELYLELLFLKPDGTGWQVMQQMPREQVFDAARDIKAMLGLK